MVLVLLTPIKVSTVVMLVLHRIKKIRGEMASSDIVFIPSVIKYHSIGPNITIEEIHTHRHTDMIPQAIFHEKYSILKAKSSMK
jgi:hypothetical protein